MTVDLVLDGGAEVSRSAAERDLLDALRAARAG